MRESGTTGRTRIIGSLAFSFLVSCSLNLHAQPLRQVTIGVLGFFTETEGRFIEHSLADQLQAKPGRPALSYRVTVLQTAYNNADMATAVARLRALRPDVVLVTSPILVEIALPRISQVPIVSGGEAIIENLPYIKTVAQPGGRVTGFFRQVNQFSKRVELLKGFCPKVRKVGMVTGSPAISDLVFHKYLDRESKLLRNSGIAVMPLYIDVDQFSLLPALIRDNNLDALDVVYSLDVRDHFSEVKAILASLGIPHVFNQAQAVHDGGAFAAQPAAFDFVKTGAEYVVRIAHGEKAGDIPIQISRAYDIVINTERIQDFKGCDARRIARVATRFYPQ
jgi:putative tryptophan/tyrosine transport system substrate-binding protein